MARSRASAVEAVAIDKAGCVGVVATVLRVHSGDRSICSRTLYSSTRHVQGNLVPGSPGEGHGVEISA